MPPCHRGDTGIRRFEQQQRDGLLARHPDRDAATERLAVENDSVGADALGIEEVESGAGVGKEALLRRTAEIAAIAAIFEEQDPEASVGEMAQTVAPIGDIAAISMEINDDPAIRLRRHVPGQQTKAIRGDDLALAHR